MLKRIISNSLISILLLTSCTGGFKAGDARKIPANMKERQRQNIEETQEIRMHNNKSLLFVYVFVPQI